MDVDPVPTLINNSHHQYYQSETTMEAASFDDPLAAALLGEEGLGFSYPQSHQWDFNYDFIDQFITPPPYNFTRNNNNNSNNGNDSVEMLVSSGTQEPGRLSKKRKQENKSRKRHPSQVQDHILAERKRREVLSHMFITLSTMIPGLKKMDKTTILGDAIKHMKHLQEKVKKLEEMAAQHNTVNSMVVVKKYKLTMDDDSDDSNDNDSSSVVDNINGSGDSGGRRSNDGSNNNNTDNHNEDSLPEIEVQISDKTLLLKVFCENRTGIMSELAAVVEKYDMNITNCSVIPFKDFALDITIVAQMENGFNKNVKDFVRTLRCILHASKGRS